MWEQIRSNQTRSALLVVWMGILLLLLGYFLGLYFLGDGIIGLIIATMLWIIMSLVGYFQGDSILLASSRARKITPDDHPRLYNVIEEMKIASGLEKMPAVYIMDDPAMNAFATGRDPKKASVAVTSGLLQKLNRDELQGVVGHEMAHIKNRDVLLMAMCAVLLGTIVMLAWYGSRFMIFGGMGRTRRSSSSGGSAGTAIIVIVALVLMILAPIFAQLIYFALSRRREYLADASSALYTRYPEGLASALEKISGSTEQLKSANKATAPMYIINPFRKQGMSAEDLTSTHPPISQRIHILRAMGGASYQDYSTAYQQVLHTDKVFIPAAAAVATGSIALRAAQPEPTQKLEEVQRVRETTNALWNAHNYRTINCACGTKLRLPPTYKLPEVKCPHCGGINPV
ncbi:MAG: M48 family metallopeptidase [Dehalococcoidia bacterium]|nr:M48 family metallopeptidase [Dehalococcoidia bacterium]